MADRVRVSIEHPDPHAGFIPVCHAADRVVIADDKATLHGLRYQREPLEVPLDQWKVEVFNDGR